MAGATVQFDTDYVEALLSRTVRGDELVRMAQVIGLDNTVNDGHALLGLALGAPDVPIVGIDVHPSRPDLVCTRIDARHMTDSPTKVELTIIYGIPQFDASTEPVDGVAQIRGDVTVQSVTTSKDIHGHPIKLAHIVWALDAKGQKQPNTKWPDELEPPDKSPQQFEFLVRPLKSTAKIEVLRPMYTFGLMRRESRSPSNIALRFVGTTNGRSWFGFKPNTILCTGIPFDSSDGGNNFAVTYSFQYNPETWRADVVIEDNGEIAGDGPNGPVLSFGDALDYDDPRTGEPRPPASRTFVQVYRRKDFHDLDLLRDDPGPALPSPGRL